MREHALRGAGPPCYRKSISPQPGHPAALDSASTYVAHDAAGNMTTAPQPGSWSSAYTLTWDAWNRLVKVVDGSTTKAEYKYDGKNRRIAKLVYSGGSLSYTDHFYLSEQDQTLEVRRDSSTNALRQYTWGGRYIDDLLLRQRDTDSNGTLDETLYPLQDSGWNVVALADTSGSVVERFKYDPYGRSTVLDGNFALDSDGLSDYDWEYRFTSRQRDAETGLHYFRARYYHDGLGRFIGRDPLSYIDGGSLYAGYFVPGNFDPWGLGEPSYCDVPIAFGQGVYAGYVSMIGGFWRPVEMVTGDLGYQRLYDDAWRPLTVDNTPNLVQQQADLNGRVAWAGFTAAVTLGGANAALTRVAPVAGTISLEGGPQNAFVQNASNAPQPQGMLNVVVHGAQNSVFIGNSEVNHRVLANIISRNPQFTGQPINLLSCQTGATCNGLAQNLSNKLGVPVFAPNNMIWAWPNGYTTIGPTPFQNTGQMVPFCPGNF